MPDSLYNPHALPPANGKQVISDISEFVAIVNSGTRNFRNPDEAYRNSRVNARRMRLDLDIMQPLKARQMASCLLPGHVEPPDKRDKYQAFVAKEAQEIIEAIPHYLKLKMWLSEGIWYGRSATQQTYKWNFAKPFKRLMVDKWAPINGDSLVFKFDGTPGVLVNPTQIEPYTTPLDVETTDLGLAHYLTPWEREAFVIHKHEIAAGDFFEPESAGSFEGLGLRHTIYWTYYLKQEVHSWLTEFAERTGLGYTIFYFEQGNDRSEAAVRKLAEAQAYENVILWPRSPQGTNMGPGVERIEPNATGIDSMLKLIDEFYNQKIIRYIQGQTLTSESKPLGIGGGAADVQADTFSRIVRYDAINLQETISRDLLGPIVRWTWPDVDFPLRYVIDVERPDPEKSMAAAKQLWEMGAAIDEDELRGILGLTKPDENSSILMKVSEAPQLVNDQAPTDDEPIEQAEAVDQVDQVQDTALNGAQITSLLEIINQVATGQLPPTTGRLMISAAFPALNPAKVEAMMTSLDGFTPATPGEAPADPPGKAPQLAEVNDQAEPEKHDATSAGGSNTFSPGFEGKRTRYRRERK